MFEFKEEDILVKQQILLIDEGRLKREDVLDLFNLREVVNYALDKRDSGITKNDSNAMEGGVEGYDVYI